MFGYRVPAPNEAMLISGGKNRTGNSPFRVVTGHGAFVLKRRRKPVGRGTAQGCRARRPRELARTFSDLLSPVHAELRVNEAGALKTALLVGLRIVTMGGRLKTLDAPGDIPLANQLVGSLP